jgi:hypothetical protein
MVRNLFRSIPNFCLKLPTVTFWKSLNKKVIQIDGQSVGCRFYSYRAQHPRGCPRSTEVGLRANFARWLTIGRAAWNCPRNGIESFE